VRRVVGSMEGFLRSRECRMVECRWRPLFGCGLKLGGATFRSYFAQLRVVKGVAVIIAHQELADVLILGIR